MTPIMRINFSLFFASLLTLNNLANAQTDKPNILVNIGDDIGYCNLSYNNDGMMGDPTFNIDSIAEEGVSFINYYAQQSCTAGRAIFNLDEALWITTTAPTATIKVNSTFFYNSSILIQMIVFELKS